MDSFNDKETALLAGIKNKSPNSFVALFEPYTKLIFGISAICYASGILVVNIFLGKYGFYSLSLFRITYVLAGFWSIITLSYVSFVINLLFGLIFQLFKKDIFLRKRLRFIFEIIIVIIFSFSIPEIIAQRLDIIFNLAWLGIPIWGAFGILSFSENFKLFTFNWESTIGNPDSIFKTLWSITYIVMYIVALSTSIYETIPSRLGGGRPQPIQIGITKKIQPIFAYQKMPLTNLTKDSTMLNDASFITDTIHLLLLSDKELIFGMKNNEKQAFSVNRDDIKFIKYVKEEFTQ